MAKRWARRCRADAPRARRPTLSSAGALLALAYPDRIAKSRGGNGAFLLANGRGANVDPASPLAREPFLAVAELAGTAAQSRILLAAPITLAEIEQRFADRIERRDEISFDAATREPARRAAASASARSRWPSSRCRSSPSDGSRAHAGRRHRRARHRPAAVDEGAAAMARPRDVPAPRRRRRMARPVRRRARRHAADWLAPLLDGKTALARHLGRRSRPRPRRAAAVGPAPPARRRGADAFRGADRLVGADRLRRRGGPEARDPRAGAVRPRPPSDASPAARCRWSSSCCRRRTGRCR